MPSRGGVKKRGIHLNDPAIEPPYHPRKPPGGGAGVSQINLTAARLRTLLAYNPETGIFTRLSKNNRRHLIGEICGYRMSNGYISITVDGVGHLAHRLAYLYMTGGHPPDQVDHRDLNKSNNAWNNLRPANRSQQSSNVGAKSTNKYGMKGVYQDKRRGTYYAQIKIDGKRRFLGARHSIQEAHALYCEAAIEAFGEFARFC